MRRFPLSSHLYSVIKCVAFEPSVVKYVVFEPREVSSVCPVKASETRAGA